MWLRIRKYYFVIGRALGGLIGVVAFLAAWMFLISRFGLIFGVALGWIPAAVIALIASVFARYAWGPLALVAAFILTAPLWDKHHDVPRITARAEAYAARQLKWADHTIQRGAKWTRQEARKEGLIGR
jgi:hypothetical protein